jgi:zinc transporter
MAKQHGPADAKPDRNGILWAYRLQGAGGFGKLETEPLDRKSAPGEFGWVHMILDAKGAGDWLARQGFSEDLVDAMTTIGTRPRAAPLADGELVVLRGVNTNPEAETDDMVSIRLWFTRDLVISARRKGRRLFSALDVRNGIEAGNIPTTPGRLVVEIIERLADRIGEAVDTIDDRLTELETQIGELDIKSGRRDLSILRRQAAAIRRYLAPQRDALDALYRTRGVLADAEAYDVREQTDRMTRYVEDLDLARERAMVLQEELQNRVAEQQNARMYVLSIVAAVFLPLSFLTGVFGMNVAGLPGTENASAFAVLSIAMAALGVGLLVFMRWRRWL